MRFYYFILLAITLTGPLLYSFNKKLKFYKKWPLVLMANAGMMLLFIPWDVFFTKQHIWWFGAKYCCGIQFLNLPIEEWLFFLLIPFSCIFIYEILKHYWFPQKGSTLALLVFLVLVAGILILVGIKNSERYYTMSSFLLAGLFIILLVLFRPTFLNHFLMMYAISLLPFFFINGALTGMFSSQPVVCYNESHILGIRLVTIPLEDAFYSFSMLLTSVYIYEKLNKQAKTG